MEPQLLKRDKENKEWLIDVADINNLRTQLHELQDGQVLTEEGWSESLKQLCELKYALDETSIIVVTDVSGVITYVNKTFCEISKYSKDELIGKTHKIIRSGYHPKEFFKEMWGQISSGTVWRKDICNRAKDGSHYWVDTTIIPFLNEAEKPYQYLAIRNEVTEKILIRKALEVLLECSVESSSENYFDGICQALRDLLRVSYVMINEKDKERGFCLSACSEQGKEEQLLSSTTETPWGQLINKDSLSITNNLSTAFPDVEILDEIGAESFVGVALKNARGVVIGNISLIDNKPNERENLFLKIVKLFARRIEVDIERQIALKALKDSEARIKAVISSSLDGIVVIDRFGKIDTCNPTASQILQCCPVEVYGRSIEEFLPGLFERGHNIEERLKKLVSHHSPQGQEVIKRLLSGGVLPLYVTVSEAKLEKHSLFTLTIRSLKEQKETEDRLRSTEDQLSVQTLFTQRLSALAAMAGGVAHELNQPLSGIRVYAQMIKKFLETPESLNADLAQEIMGKVINQVDRASKIIDHMREFSADKGDRELQLQKISVHDVVESSLELIGQQFRSIGISFHNEIDPTHKIMANESRLEQIFINLFSNAKDSIMEKHNKEQSFIKIRSVSLANDIELYIEDNGSGIPIEVQNNLFEPFVTSKDPGSGTGLGLSICLGILKDFNSSISLVKTGAEGTVFKLKFPRAE